MRHLSHREGREAHPRCSSFGSCTSLRPIHSAEVPANAASCSSFGSCTSLRQRHRQRPAAGDVLQFLRELHFIEAGRRRWSRTSTSSCSSFGSCTSLRLSSTTSVRTTSGLQFLRELHFIEARCSYRSRTYRPLQFLRELHFIEAPSHPVRPTPMLGCSSFGSCTSLRPSRLVRRGTRPQGCSSFGSCTSLRHRRQPDGLRRQ